MRNDRYEGQEQEEYLEEEEEYVEARFRDDIVSLLKQRRGEEGKNVQTPMAHLFWNAARLAVQHIARNARNVCVACKAISMRDVGFA